MVVSSFGVVMFVALHTGLSCERAFEDMARTVGYQEREPGDADAMREFAAAACATTNPDILWQLAFQETDFRFQLVRENLNRGLANLYEGEAAPAFLKRLKAMDLNRNIDIGVMQFNWAWHHQGFHDDPVKVLSPKLQVEYFLQSFSGEIYDRCHGRWVGCYHSTSDQSRASRYEQEVLEKGRILRLQALRMMRKLRSDMPHARKVELPPILQDDIDKLLVFTREAPIPLKR
ncbi:MAG: hypothetical protein H7249_06500 [Chitinophagaceae bacterium]|nr:hypothetical protein [Oligoflexus sp.]